MCVRWRKLQKCKLAAGPVWPMLPTSPMPLSNSLNNLRPLKENSKTPHRFL